MKEPTKDGRCAFVEHQHGEIFLEAVSLGVPEQSAWSVGTVQEVNMVEFVAPKPNLPIAPFLGVRPSPARQVAEQTRF